MPDKKTLDYYVAELRRIEKSRQADTEKQVKKLYKELLKDLNSFLGNEYASYSDGDGVLSVAVLQEKARYAKFLQEVEQHLNSITPEISKTIKSTVQDTYKAVYTGMVDAVTKSVDDEELAKKLKGLSLRPEVMKNAIENPISGLTLPDTLEKHRKEVIYNIKQQINIGLMTGGRYDTMAKNVNKVISGDDGTGGLYGKAVNIVRTEVHRVQESGFNDCAEDISESLEGSGLIYAATWRNMGDEKVRPSYRVHTSKGWKTKIAKTTANHQKMEGVTIRVGDKFEIEPGVFAKCPGSSGTARNDCNCRCFLEYSLMTIERFAKATNKTVEEVEKELGIVDNIQGKQQNDVAKTEEKDYNKNIATASSRYLNKNDKLFKNAANIKPLDGYEDIVSHGDRYGLVFKDSEDNETNISAKEFVEMLKNDTNYKGGNIRLIACEAGAGEGIVPQYIANELNVEVLAPTEIVQVFPDGQMFVANKQKDALAGKNTGEWKIFKPKGR